MFRFREETGMNRFLIATFAIGAFGVGSALADTTDQTWMNKVELQKIIMRAK